MAGTLMAETDVDKRLSLEGPGLPGRTTFQQQVPPGDVTSGAWRATGLGCRAGDEPGEPTVGASCSQVGTSSQVGMVRGTDDAPPCRTAGVLSKDQANEEFPSTGPGTDAAPALDGPRFH